MPGRPGAGTLRLSLQPQFPSRRAESGRNRARGLPASRPAAHGDYGRRPTDPARNGRGTDGDPRSAQERIPGRRAPAYRRAQRFRRRRHRAWPPADLAASVRPESIPARRRDAFGGRPGRVWACPPHSMLESGARALLSGRTGARTTLYQCGPRTAIYYPAGPESQIFSMAAGALSVACPPTHTHDNPGRAWASPSPPSPPPTHPQRACGQPAGANHGMQPPLCIPDSAETRAGAGIQGGGCKP